MENFSCSTCVNASVLISSVFILIFWLEIMNMPTFWISTCIILPTAFHLLEIISPIFIPYGSRLLLTRGSGHHNIVLLHSFPFHALLPRSCPVPFQGHTSQTSAEARSSVPSLNRSYGTRSPHYRGKGFPKRSMDGDPALDLRMLNTFVRSSG